MAKWVNGFEPGLIIERIKASMSANNQGRVGFDAFPHQENLAALRSMIDMDRTIVRADQASILRRAVSLAAERRLDSEEVLGQVGKLEQQHLALPTRRFRLVSQISTKIALPPVTRSLAGTRIVVGWRLDKATMDARLKEVQPVRASIVGGGPKSYSYVSTTLSARTSLEAFSNGIDALDLLRARWNYFLNRGANIRITWGKRGPANSIVLGPIHTLHRLNGQIERPGLWQDHAYQWERHPWGSVSILTEMLNYESKLRARVRKSAYVEEINSAIVRYGRALDSADWNYAFLQLWSVIEMLTATGINESHQQTAKRATFVFQDSDHARQFLLHLRSTRNRAIHQGGDPDDAETVMFQAKRAVEGLLMFHVRFSGVFESMREAAEMLELPTSISTIEGRVEKLRRAQKFLSVSTSRR